MKYFVFIHLLIVSISANAQKDSSLNKLLISLERRMNIPPAVYKDTCYFSNTLLRVKLNSQYKVIEISLSDNAEDWLIDEVQRLILNKELDTASLEKYARKSGIKNASFILPITARSEWGQCYVRSIYWFSRKYYQFKGKLLEGNCIFLDPFELVLTGWSS